MRGRQLSLPERLFVLRRSAVTFWVLSGLDIGAKLTFFALLAFAPTVLAVYSVATLFLANNQDLVRSLSDELISDYVLSEYEELARNVVGMVTGSAAGGIAGIIISVLISMFSASAYVRAFARSANDIYGVREGRSIVKFWLHMWLVTVALVLAMVVVLAALTVNDTVVGTVLGPVARFFDQEQALAGLSQTFLPVWRWVRWPVAIAMLLLILDVLYHFTPNVELPYFRRLSSGSLVALAGVIIVALGFAAYISLFGGLSSYGALGTLLAALFALWWMNVCVVFGLIVDAETEKLYQLSQGRWQDAAPAEADAQAQVPGRENFASIPLRASDGVEFQNRVQERLDAEQRRRFATPASEQEDSTNTADAPGSDTPATDAAGNDAPATDAPSGDTPATDAADTEAAASPPARAAAD